MLERPQKHQAFADPQEFGGSVDTMRRPAEGRDPSPAEPSSSSSSIAPGNDGNVDRVLFKNLVEIVPLVESLMDRRARSSFTRRASVFYTPTPSQLRKVPDPSGTITAQTTSAKKRKDTGDSAANDFSIFSSRAAADTEKDRKELVMLRELVDDLQKKLLEKDEALKSAENSINKLNAAYVSLDELRHQVAEKDSLIKSANSELYNAKIKLADKQAALEKLEWEVRMSDRKVEELQGNAVSMEFEVTALMQLFEELSKNVSAAYPDVDIDSFNYFEQLPHIDDIDVEKMEEERAAYLAAVAAAKESPSEKSIAAATEARLRLQAFVL